MPVSDWLPLMPDTLYHTEFTGRSDYGKPTYGSAVSYRCRVVYKTKNVRDKQGNIVVARGTVWIAGTPTISPEDQITLPDGTTPPILSADLFTDDTGNHHVRCYFG